MRRVLTVVALAAFAAGLGCDGGNEPAPLAAPGPLTAMTFNIANGASDRYRTADNRERQGAFVARSAPDVVGMEEVDVGVDRSGDVDTAAAVAEAISAGFSSCSFAVADPPHFRIDGTRLARCADGAIAFGIGFRADDPFAAGAGGAPSGIQDGDDSLNPTGVDRGADAFYGNALVVRAPWEIGLVYTVALPMDASGPAAPAELLERLARSAPDDAAIAALADHNQERRRQIGIEPRSALVARVRKAGTTEITVITTHLESAGPKELRRAQLDALAAIALAERQDGERPVLVMGDFNMPPSDAEPAMTAAGLVRAATPEATGDVDQIWVDAALAIEAASRPPTEGASDHAFAATATVR